MSIDRLEQKIDKIDERLDAIHLTLEKNTSSLVEHMRRTVLIEEDVKPIKAHVSFINSVAKFISGLLAAALAAKSLGLF